MHTEWTPELEAALAEPFPPEAHKTKKLGGTEITFVSVWNYVERLNELVGVNGWHLMVDTTDAGGKLIAAVSLTVLGTTKTNLGDEKEEKDDFGTAATNSWAQGFKRCCALFGLGLYMYDKKGREAAKKPKPATKKKPPVDRGAAPIIPSGKYEGTALDDPDLPMSYLIKTASDMERTGKAAWAKKFQDEIDRRKAAAGVKP